AGFISMYGNIPFALRVIGLAVVFAILLVAANTMVMSIRERTREIGVLKTLGFADGTLFTLVVVEAAMITALAGTIGALLAKLALEGGQVNLGGFLPAMSVYWGTVFTGIGIALSYNVRNVLQRPVSTLTTAAGIALTVAILIGALSLAAGFQTALRETGSRDNALVLRSGADSEISSAVSREAIGIIRAHPQVKAGPDGRPMLSAEVVVLINKPRL